MRTTLVYFDEPRESRKGTVRGLLSTGLLGVGYAGYATLYQRNSWSWQQLPYVVVFLVLWASALSVQTPTARDQAVGYGFLVGVVIAFALIMGRISRVSPKQWYSRDILWEQLKIVAFMSLLSLVTSLVLFEVFWA